MRRRRRDFGWLRTLPSGRVQASYIAPDGLRRVAPHTFATRSDADRWLTMIRATLISGNWHDPARSRQRFGEFAERWIGERPGLRPRTVELYEWLYHRYLEQQLAGVAVGDITPGLVRTWHAELRNAGTSQSMTAKAYRLLRAILMTAVDDGTIQQNPCRIRGAGMEPTAERPILSVNQVFALAARMPERIECMIVVATFASLRWGEVTALHRRDIDVENRSVTVREAHIERRNGALELGPPKSKASLRTVAIPHLVAEALRKHLADFTGPGTRALVFTGPTGVPLRKSNFNKLVRWSTATEAIGAPGLRFHDLRHTGNTLAAGTLGTSTRDLMQRMGHDSIRAALIYQHATRDADRRIAEGLTVQIGAASSGRGQSLTARRQHASAPAPSRRGTRKGTRPRNRGLPAGAGDGNRTRTVSLGS